MSKQLLSTMLTVLAIALALSGCVVAEPRQTTRVLPAPNYYPGPAGNPAPAPSHPQQP